MVASWALSPMTKRISRLTLARIAIPAVISAGIFFAKSASSVIYRESDIVQVAWI